MVDRAALASQSRWLSTQIRVWLRIQLLLGIGAAFDEACGHD